MRTIRAALGVALALLAIGVGGVRADSRVQYYPVPAGAGPHDVAPAPDGTVWYTAQRQGALGRLDPRTGQTVQVPLGRGSAPHCGRAWRPGLPWCWRSRSCSAFMAAISAAPWG